MKEKEEDEKQKVYKIGGEAGVKLVEHYFNPPLDKEPEMTVIGRAQSLYLSMVLVMRDIRQSIVDQAKYQLAYDKWVEEGEKGKPPKEPELFFYSDRWSHYYMQLQTSIGGRKMKAASDLALAEIEASTEEEEFKEPDWKD